MESGEIGGKDKTTLIMNILPYSKLKKLIDKHPEFSKELQIRTEMMLKIIPSYGKKNKGFIITKK